MASQAPAELPRCSAEGCTNEAPFACPTCKELGLTDGIAFCGKECFKLAWKVHKKVHAIPPPPPSPTAPAPTSATAPAPPQPAAPAPSSATATFPSVAPKVAKSEASAAVGSSEPSSATKAQPTAQPCEMPETKEMACWYTPCGRHCYKDDSKRPSALEVYRSAVTQHRQCEGRPSKHLAESLYRCSRVLLEYDYVDPTLGIAMLAESMYEQCGGKDATHAAMLINIADVATAARTSMQFSFSFVSRAIMVAYTKALRIFEALEDKDSEAVSLVHCNLGYACKNFGDFEKAKEEHFADLAFCYVRPGAYKDDYKKAMDYYLECLHIQERTNKINTALGASVHYNIGMLYHAMGDLDNALKFLEKALELRICVVGPFHHDVGVCYRSIGEVHTARNDLAKALEYHMLEMTAMASAHSGQDHPTVLAAHLSIAKIHRKQGNIDFALDHYNLAADIAEKVLAQDDVDFGILMLEAAHLSVLNDQLDSSLLASRLVVDVAVSNPGSSLAAWATLQDRWKHAATAGNSEALNAIMAEMETLMAGFRTLSTYDEDVDSIYKSTSANATLPQRLRRRAACGSLCCT